eukprot:CAMPEP_0195015218 /NCGR_PEP_ID=MMETSP0326_2-20130528/18526_1 /TAXON_ID=2866 ORGANISM="Crypthecodinium cohnii, Strain Seligo" /NCGR_SAMPLE_ID=MMETSP0326_2 /ASSEMBLY_ACC=CAM_ASM_000348 /LENGTH=88 /DNA_ID=CAMNT_0040029155 /DNA_START=172 /DNA_END=437 /DNA_ORIENTATION=+
MTLATPLNEEARPETRAQKVSARVSAMSKRWSITSKQKRGRQVDENDDDDDEDDEEGDMEMTMINDNSSRRRPGEGHPRMAHTSTPAG